MKFSLEKSVGQDYLSYTSIIFLNNIYPILIKGFPQNEGFWSPDECFWWKFSFILFNVVKQIVAEMSSPSMISLPFWSYIFYIKKYVSFGHKEVFLELLLSYIIIKLYKIQLDVFS